VPLPVPGKLFWSVTVYDNESRSEISTSQGKAALRSLFELKDKTDSSVDLYFGPKAPRGQEGQWIDDPRQGLVHLLPYLRAGAAGVRRHLEAGRFRRDQMNSAVRRLNENQKKQFFSLCLR
jgi:hypothetical protein